MGCMDQRWSFLRIIHLLVKYKQFEKIDARKKRASIFLLKIMDTSSFAKASEDAMPYIPTSKCRY